MGMKQAEGWGQNEEPVYLSMSAFRGGNAQWASVCPTHAGPCQRHGQYHMPLTPQSWAARLNRGAKGARRG